MKGLIINHETKFLSQLKKLFEPCDVIHYKELKSNFSDSLIKDYDYVILSGGSINISGEDDLIYEKSFLRKTKKPIIGICLGFEILCILEGSELLPLKSMRKGFFNLNFLGVEGKLFQSHSWFIKDVSDSYEVLSKSEEIVEVIVHKTKPFFGIQGHIEMSDDFGKKIRDFFFDKFV